MACGVQPPRCADRVASGGAQEGRLELRWVTIAGLALVLAVPLGRATAATIDTFLKRPVHSLSEFLAQVRRDEVVQKRYGKHLGIAWQEVPRYLERRLKPATIMKTGFFTVYNVTTEGAIFPTKQRLTAGTRVYRLQGSPHFFTQRGEPARPFFRPTVERVEPEPKQPQPQAPPSEPVVQVEVVIVPSE